MIRIRQHSGFRHLVVLLACGWTLGWANTWDGIKNTPIDITAVEARFVQEKHLKILNKPLISHGVLTFQAPDSLRWEYTAPIKSVLLMNKGKVKRFIESSSGFKEDANPALPLMQQVLQEMTVWLEGRFDDNEKFTATLKPGPVIELTPKSDAVARMIKRIELVLDKRPGVIHSVTIFEGQDAYTKFSFVDVELNRPIEPSVFQKI